MRTVAPAVAATMVGIGPATSGATQPSAPGLTFVVNTTVDAVDAHPGDGQCQTAAGTCTLRAAVQEANAHPGADTVQLPAGTYALTIANASPGGEDHSATGDLDIRDDLTVVGAGATTTIIDASAILPDRVIDVRGPLVLTIRGVALRNRLLFSTGGGLRNQGGTVTLDHVSIDGTTDAPDGQPGPPVDGGGIFNSPSGNLTIIDSTISGGAGPQSDFGFPGAGGGLANAGTATVIRSTLSGRASHNGGAISNTGTLTLSHSRVSGFANVAGGGISTAGRLTLGFSAVTASGAGDGAGIEARSGVVTITNSTIRDNEADNAFSSFGGGGLRVTNAHLELSNSTVSSNAVSSIPFGTLLAGAGILLDGNAAATITNVTISRNTYVDTGTGGGLAVRGAARAKVANSTITANSGQFVHTVPTSAGISGPVRLLNTIVAHNTVQRGDGSVVSEANCEEPPSSMGHNLDGGSTCHLSGPGDLQDLDPRLGPLGQNGGTTLTHALLPGSPAIDAGSNAGCPATDQRGLPRPRDGNGDGVAVCDVGSFEVQS